MSRSKKAMMGEKYYDLSEDEMQALISKAKQQDPKAQSDLLKIFDNFLTKYSTMLYYGKYSLSDYDIRQFVALFVKDSSVRKYLSRNKLNLEGRRHVNEVMSGIRYMITRYGDEDDIRQTVDLTFLQCVDIYERKESKRGGYVPFSGYLYSYFYYVLKKNVESMLIDQLGRKTFPLISDDEQFGDESDGEERTVGFTGPPEPSAEDFLYAEIIDEDWVAGETAYFPFDTLTVQERQLLKWRYVNGESSSKISKKITEHSNTVRENLSRIRTKIEKALAEQHE